MVGAEEMPESIPDQPTVWGTIGVDELRAAVDQLPDDVRDTYRMCAFEGLKHEKIAEIQRIAIATVGTRIFRARKQLRSLLTKAAQESP
jgi:RNA polymerase sigma-70 factor (ECF subfamily)